MAQLSSAELQCLQNIARGTTADKAPACSDQVLSRLLALGLIERATVINLPWEMLRSPYKLTDTGYARLTRR